MGSGRPTVVAVAACPQTLPPPPPKRALVEVAGYTTLYGDESKQTPQLPWEGDDGCLRYASVPVLAVLHRAEL